MDKRTPVANVAISAGTLRTEDLLRAFSTELAYLDVAGEYREVAVAGKVLADALEKVYWGDMPSAEKLDEEAAMILEELFDVLNEYAPEGFYFGSHEGDGAAFGFWSADD